MVLVVVHGRSEGILHQLAAQRSPELIHRVVNETRRSGHDGLLERRPHLGNILMRNLSSDMSHRSLHNATYSYHGSRDPKVRLNVLGPMHKFESAAPEELYCLP